jgi:hypothetical protein
MNQVAIGPNGEYKIQIDGKWHSVDSLAEDPTSGARKGKVGELWYDIPQADVDPLQARVDAAATAAQNHSSDGQPTFGYSW